MIIRSSQEAPPLVLEYARRELWRLAADQQLQLTWLPDDPPSAVAGRLVVIRLHGACVGAPHSSLAGPLATAVTQGGRVQPFIDVYCERIAALLTPRLLRLDPLMRQLQFSRALARVIAHELHHVLEGTRDHTGTGLTKARLSGEELTRKRADFSLEIAPRRRLDDTPNVEQDAETTGDFSSGR